VSNALQYNMQQQHNNDLQQWQMTMQQWQPTAAAVQQRAAVADDHAASLEAQLLCGVGNTHENCMHWSKVSETSTLRQVENLQNTSSSHCHAPTAGCITVQLVSPVSQAVL
jgi:hypothetical protein